MGYYFTDSDSEGSYQELSSQPNSIDALFEWKSDNDLPGLNSSMEGPRTRSRGSNAPRPIVSIEGSCKVVSGYFKKNWGYPNPEQIHKTVWN
jgi:hypothetical protein